MKGEKGDEERVKEEIVEEEGEVEMEKGQLERGEGEVDTGEGRKEGGEGKKQIWCGIKRGERCEEELKQKQENLVLLLIPSA